jgi:hypothetical protein
VSWWWSGTDEAAAHSSADASVSQPAIVGTATVGVPTVQAVTSSVSTTVSWATPSTGSSLLATFRSATPGTPIVEVKKGRAAGNFQGDAFQNDAFSSPGPSTVLAASWDGGGVATAGNLIVALCIRESNQDMGYSAPGFVSLGTGFGAILTKTAVGGETGITVTATLAVPFTVVVFELANCGALDQTVRGAFSSNTTLGMTTGALAQANEWVGAVIGFTSAITAGSVTWTNFPEYFEDTRSSAASSLIPVTAGSASITTPSIGRTAVVGVPTVITEGPIVPAAVVGTATVGAPTVQANAAVTTPSMGKTKTIGAVSVSTGGTTAIGVVTQTNTALAITRAKRKTLTIATQPSTAIAFAKKKIEQLVTNLEFDQPLTIVPSIGGGGTGPPPAGDPSIWKVSIYNLNGTVVLDRAPVQSWMFNYVLNAPGAFEADLQLNHASVTEAIFGVGAKEIRIYRGTILVWGGYLWGIQISATDYKARIRGEGYFSRLRRRIIADDLIKKDRDQADVAWDLIQYTQATHGTFGFTDGHTQTGVTVDHAYCATDLGEIGGAIEELSEMDNSFDFWITPTISTPTNKIFQTAVPRRGATKAVTINQNNAISADYEIDAMDLSNRIWGVGSGECNPPDFEASASASITTYGELHSTITYDDLDNLPSVKAHTREDLRLNKDPRRQVTVTLEERDYTWGSFDIGDIITLASNRGYITGTRQMRVIRIQTNFDPENRIAFHEIDLDSVIA